MKGNTEVINDHENNEKAIFNMASKVIKMEESMDTSMRGAYLDRLVSNYMLLYNSKIIKMFDAIYNGQIEVEEGYGDYDLFVRKLNFLNKNERDVRHGYSEPAYRGLLLNDNCGTTGTFIIIESVTSYELAKDVCEKTYRCFKVEDENINEIDLSLLKIGFNNYIISYKIVNYGHDINNSIDILDHLGTPTYRGVMRYYDKFKDLVQILNEAFYGYNDNKYIE